MVRKATLVVGLDFDNTIADYDNALHRLALRRRLIDKQVKVEKNQIRDHVRRLTDGESQWQKLQGTVYGPEISQARLAKGVESFFQACQRQTCNIYIISHKTEYAAQDETHTNLRTAALEWMTSHSFFESDGLGLSPSSVFFEATRSAKLQRIRELGCTHVVDDLRETFLEADFSADVVKILYSPHGSEPELLGVNTVGTWEEITKYVFNDID